MAWGAITNNTGWQYNNAPADPGVGSPLRPLWQKQTNGIRQFKNGTEVYVEVRKVGDTNRTRGEMSKSFWDSRT